MPNLIIFSFTNHGGDIHGDTSTTSRKYLLNIKYFLLSVPSKSSILSVLFSFCSYFVADS